MSALRQLHRPLLLCLALLWLGLAPARAAAQDAIQIDQNEISQDFPTGATFSLVASSSAPIETVTLRYGTTGRSCQSNGASQPLAVTPATNIALSWTWDWARFGILPPGTVVWWEWTVSDAAGQSVTSERQFATVADARFPFKEATADNVSVFWTMGDAAFGEQLLAYATAGLDRLQTEMGIQLDEPITLVVYPTAADVQAAVIHVPEWAGGVAFPRYNSIIVGIAPGQDSWAASVIPHELTHLVVGALTFNCVGVDLPTWLNEGLAEFGETGAASSTAPELLNALEAGNVPALRRLANGFSAYGDDAGLAYVQSKTIVNFLISEYGQANLLLLLEAMREGADIDDALQQVYGLDTDGLDGAWRQSLGYQPLPTRQPTPDPAQATPVPTIAPFTLDLPDATATASPTNTAIPPTSTATIAPGPTDRPTETPAATAIADVSEPTAAPTAAPAESGAIAEPPAGSAPWLLPGGIAILLAGGLLYFVLRMVRQPR